MVEEVQVTQEDLNSGDAIMEALMPTTEENPTQEEEKEETPTQEGKAPAQEEETSTKEEETSTKEEEEEEYISTLKELAEANEWDMEQIYDLNVSLGEDTEPVALRQLVNDYKTYQTESQKYQQSVEANQNYLSQQNEALENFVKESAIAGQILLNMEQNLNQMMEAPDMIALKQSNAGKYAERMLEIKQHAENLQRERQQLSQHYDNSLNGMRQNYLQTEVHKLQTAWGDNAETNLDQAFAALKSTGMGEDEIANIMDSRILLAAHELHTLREKVKAYEQKGAAVEKAKKQIKKLPKKAILRPSQKKTKTGNVVPFSEQFTKFNQKVKSGEDGETEFLNALSALES